MRDDAYAAWTRLYQDVIAPAGPTPAQYSDVQVVEAYLSTHDDDNPIQIVKGTK